MMRKTILLSFLIVINCLLDSCSSNNAFCFDLELTSIQNFTLDGYHDLNSGNTVAASDYAILLEGESMSATCLVNYSFGGSLLADEPSPTFIDKVTNVSIKSNADLSSNYLAENELKELFIPITITANCLNSTITNPDCVTDNLFNSGYTSLEEVLNDVISQNILFGNQNRKFLFSLDTNEMIANNTHEITIIFDFKSGKSAVFRTEQFLLNE